jgi:predicted glutamine amidotransferase
MCAIAGWFGLKLKYETDRTKLLVHLARKIQAGGDKSFGISWMKDGKGQLTKFTGAASQWLQQNIKELPAISKSSAVLMHARQPTHGNVTKTNCHPFAIGNWYAAHNGVLRNSKELMSKAMYVAAGETDSEEALCYIVGENWSAESLSKLQGYYAFEAMKKDGSQVLLIADSCARLHFAYVGDGVVWATDPDVLESSLKAVGIKAEPIKLKCQVLKMPGRTITEFKEGSTTYYSSGYSSGYTGHHSRSWDDETGINGRWDPVTKTWEKSKDTQPTATTEPADGLQSID